MLLATAGDVINAWIVVVVVIVLYWLPTIVAFHRGVVNQWSVAVINLFLGWTVIGWVVALAMAVRTQREQKTA